MAEFFGPIEGGLEFGGLGGVIVGVLEEAPTAPFAPLADAGEVAEEVATVGFPGGVILGVDVFHARVGIGRVEELGEVGVVLAALHADEVLAGFIAEEFEAVLLCDLPVFLDPADAFGQGVGFHVVEEFIDAPGGDIRSGEFLAILGDVHGDVRGDGEGIGVFTGVLPTGDLLGDVTIRCLRGEYAHEAFFAAEFFLPEAEELE